MSTKSTSVSEQLRSINAALAATSAIGTSSASGASKDIQTAAGKAKEMNGKDDEDREKEDAEEALLFDEIENGMTATATAKSKTRVALVPEKMKQVVILKQEEITIEQARLNKQQAFLNKKLNRLMDKSGIIISGSQKYMEEQQARSTQLIGQQEAYMKRLQAENDRLATELREERRIVRERDEEAAKQKWTSGTLGVVSALVTLVAVAPFVPEGVSGAVIVISAGSGAGGLGLYLGNAFYRPFYNCFVGICNLFKSDCCKSSCCCSSCCKPDSTPVAALSSIEIQPVNSSAATVASSPLNAAASPGLNASTSAVIYSPAATLAPLGSIATVSPLSTATPIPSANLLLNGNLHSTPTVPAASPIEIAASTPIPLAISATPANPNGTPPLSSPSNNNGTGTGASSSGDTPLQARKPLGLFNDISATSARPSTPSGGTPVPGIAKAYTLSAADNPRPSSATVVATPSTPSPLLVAAKAHSAAAGDITSAASPTPTASVTTATATTAAGQNSRTRNGTGAGSNTSRRQTGTTPLSSTNPRRATNTKAVARPA